MKISTYSTAWNVVKNHFDYKAALDNWATFSDEIVIAVGTSTDDTYNALDFYAMEQKYPVRLIRTAFDFENDPYAYGKTENTALQNCSGDLMVQQNLDEVMLVTKAKLHELEWQLRCRMDISAFWVPNIDLYGSLETYLPPVKKKWMIHRPGLFRGPCRQGIKPDGRPNYDVTSSDELLDITGNLVPAASLTEDFSIEGIREYVAAGGPLTYHLGYVSFGERIDRSLWWKAFWERATGGDTNQHPTSAEQMAVKAAVPHGLPMWRTRRENTIKTV